MRLKAEAILDFGTDDEQQTGIVREYRSEYKAVSEIPDANPEIFEMLHADSGKLCKPAIRGGRY